jgi:uncharacterized membrane protein YhaH (DUF805 family)
MNIRSLLSLNDPLARGPFVAAVVTVYILSFLSQMLLAAPITARTGVWPFALAQAVLIWAWYVLHARRLQDTGGATGLASGVACVYSLTIILVLIIVSALTANETSGQAAKDGQTIIAFFVVLYMLLLFSADPSLGVFGYWLMGFIALMLTPVAIAFGFSIWTALRPSVAPKP